MALMVSKSGELKTKSMSHNSLNLQQKPNRQNKKSMKHVLKLFVSLAQFGWQNQINQSKVTSRELKRYVKLCEKFETPYIRIFGGEVGELCWSQAIDEATETLDKMIEIIKDFNAKIVIETHDDWMAADHFKALMESVNSEKVGILWDVNHPFMFIGEKPEETWEKVGKWIYHTHWKDSKIANDTVKKFEPCLMGEGDLPHDQIYRVLNKGGYNGYLSLEWEKRWHPDLPDPEIAFPQYYGYMKKMMNLSLNH